MLISLLVIILVVVLLLYAATLLPIDSRLQAVLQIAIIIVAVVYLLGLR